MAYPAIDSNTLAAYELDESTLTYQSEAATSGLGLDLHGPPYFPTPPHVAEHYGSWGPFLESVANVGNAYLYDTSPAAGATTTPWRAGAPALFKPNPRGLAFLQGTATQARDYVVLGGGPTSLMQTVSMWVQPFNVAAVQELIHKEYFDCTPTDGAKSANWAAPFYAGFHLYIAGTAGAWGAEVTTAGVVHNITISAATEEHVFLRANLWNHIGCTYDGANFKAYCNGQLAKSIAVTGAIDYGAGKWVLGPLRAEPGNISAPNAVIKRLRWEKVAKPESYFFDCYASAANGGGPPQVSFG